MRKSYMRKSSTQATSPEQAAKPSTSSMRSYTSFVFDDARCNDASGLYASDTIDVALGDAFVSFEVRCIATDGSTVIAAMRMSPADFEALIERGRAHSFNKGQ